MGVLAAMQRSVPSRDRCGLASTGRAPLWLKSAVAAIPMRRAPDAAFCSASRFRALLPKSGFLGGRGRFRLKAWRPRP